MAVRRRRDRISQRYLVPVTPKVLPLGAQGAGDFAYLIWVDAGWRIQEHVGQSRCKGVESNVKGWVSYCVSRLAWLSDQLVNCPRAKCESETDSNNTTSDMYDTQ